MNNPKKVYMIMNYQLSSILEFTSDYASVIVDWDACSAKALTKNKKLQFSFFPLIFFVVKREHIKRKRNWTNNMLNVYVIEKTYKVETHIYKSFIRSYQSAKNKHGTLNANQNLK